MPVVKVTDIAYGRLQSPSLDVADVLIFLLGMFV